MSVDPTEASSGNTNSSVVHATAIALGEHGVLLRGPSGAGKSDLALRLLASSPLTLAGRSWETSLVADDYVQLTGTNATTLMMSPPAEAIRGLLEVRGVGILNLPNLKQCQLTLVVDLVASHEDVPRLPPDGASCALHGVECPRLMLYPFEVSAVAKLLCAVRMLTMPKLEDKTVPR
ncbi:MAG: HPr kinase/phosphatase C-terminal domain-containing protein [Pseudomonadota bacterium]